MDDEASRRSGRGAAAANPPRAGLGRRSWIGASLAAASGVACGVSAGPARAGVGSYQAFLEGVRAQAARQGLGGAAQVALASLSVPNARVIALDRHQPEFTLTWAQYRERVLASSRLELGADAYRERVSIFAAVERRFGVGPGVIIGIWGLESSFGKKIGTFGVVDALATLAYDGRRSAFFRSELLNALTIIDRRDIGDREMLGSYAGAMGQPQFMPSAYLHYAASFDGTDRADIWTDERDVFASIANYLAKCGWHEGEPWGQEVQLTRPLGGDETGRDAVRTLGQWQQAGVRRSDGRDFSRSDVEGALVLPDGAGGPAFMTYHNFKVIRRYNPSDFYALAVGLLGDAAT